MRDGRLDQVEMLVVFGAVGQFMMVKIFEVILSFKAVPPGPAFSDLLQENVPLRLVPMAPGRLGAKVTQGIVRGCPALKMPLARLAVGTADFCSIFFQ